MEQRIALRKSRPSLNTLDELCLLKLFQFLGVEELVNLSETCVYLKNIVDPVLKKYSTFELDRKMVLKGEKHIDHLLFHIGRQVTSLTLHCVCKFNKDYQCSRVMNWIDCKNLTSLRIHDLSKKCQSDMLLYTFVNVEVFTLHSSIINFEKNFFITILENFPKLKSLNIFYARIELDELKSVLRNNPGIESFVVRRIDCVFDCCILELIPNVEVLVLDTFDWYVNNINSLQTLHRIKKLHLNCEWMIISSKDWKVTNFSSLPQLKYLRLQSFEFTFKTLISTIRLLKCLEKFDISLCSTAKRDKSKFKELDKLSQEILKVIDDTGRQQRLDLAIKQGLIWGKGRSEVKLSNLFMRVN